MAKSMLGDLERKLSSANNEHDSSGQQVCGDIDIRIARDGTWFYHGSPIGRKPLVKLFAGVLHRDAAGDYWLETPVEKCRIRVDDAPFTAIEMIVDGVGSKQCLSFRTNVDEIVTADSAHPLRITIDPETGEPAPYVMVRDGLEALIVRAVYYDLVELGVEESRDGTVVFGLWSAGTFFALGDIGHERG
jgi:hypothetical protein